MNYLVSLPLITTRSGLGGFCKSAGEIPRMQLHFPTDGALSPPPTPCTPTPHPLNLSAPALPLGLSPQFRLPRLLSDPVGLNPQLKDQRMGWVVP